jgi:hypothetical protein
MNFLLSESTVPFLPLYLDEHETFCVVDDVDYEWASRFTWSKKLAKTGPNRKLIIYPYRTAARVGYKYSMFLHKVICFLAHGPPPTKAHVISDHCDGVSLNCRRGNLRWATPSENRQNYDGAYARQLRMFSHWEKLP